MQRAGAGVDGPRLAGRPALPLPSRPFLILLPGPQFRLCVRGPTPVLGFQSAGLCSSPLGDPVDSLMLGAPPQKEGNASTVRLWSMLCPCKESSERYCHPQVRSTAQRWWGIFGRTQSSEQIFFLLGHYLHKQFESPKVSISAPFWRPYLAGSLQRNTALGSWN